MKTALILRIISLRLIVCVHDKVHHQTAGEGKDIELRHQRNPDVLFDSVRREEGVTQNPEYHSDPLSVCASVGDVHMHLYPVKHGHIIIVYTL